MQKCEKNAMRFDRNIRTEVIEQNNTQYWTTTENSLKKNSLELILSHEICWDPKIILVFLFFFSRFFYFYFEEIACASFQFDSEFLCVCVTSSSLWLGFLFFFFFFTSRAVVYAVQTHTHTEYFLFVFFPSSLFCSFVRSFASQTVSIVCNWHTNCQNYRKPVHTVFMLRTYWYAIYIFGYFTAYMLMYDFDSSQFQWLFFFLLITWSKCFIQKKKSVTIICGA